MSDNVPVASRPTERELDLELVKLVDWQVFATHLPGLERENIEQIQRNNHEVHLQKLELFGTWLRIHPDASWKDVVLALENARENTLAEAVKRKFKLFFPVQDTSSTMGVYESHQFQHTSIEKVFLPIAVNEVQKTNDSTELLKVEERKLEVDEIAIQLVGLHKRFAQLETNIKAKLESVINEGQKTIKDIARYLERHLEDEQLILTDSKDIDDLFHKLHSYYSFLDCELLEEIVEQFVQGDAQTKFKEYVTDVEAFEELTTLQELKDAIEQALLPTQSVTPSTCEVILKVSRRWRKEKMKCLKKLLEHVFFEKHHLLKHIRITVGSMCIRFLVPKSQVKMLIALATKHKEFMYLLGVFEMMINDIPVLMEDENENFTFDSALLESSQSGNNETVQFLLDLGVNINYSNSEGKTALMLASEAGHEEVVQTLVSAEANVNLQDSAGETALVLANGNVGIIHCLLLANANLDIQRKDGNTALHIACYKGHNTVIELLLSYHSSPVIKNTKDDTPFMASVRGNNADILKLMIDAIPSSHLSSGIVLACRLGHSAVFSLSVKQLECTPQVIDLFISCAEGDVGSIIQHIMEFNIDPNTTLISGITPLMIASSCGHVEVIDTLVQMEADVNRIDIDNYSPLAYAITGNKSLPTVQYLLEAGANPHVVLGGITILERACREEGQQDICDILLKFSAVDLQKRFTHLLDRIEEGFNVIIGKAKHILLQVSQIVEVYPEITGSSKLHDLFNRVRAYSDFLSYELLVVITREFLKDNVEIQDEFEEYLSVVQRFEDLLKIEHFANVMAFLPQEEQTTMATTTYLVFKLNRQWSNKTLNYIRSLCSFLFSDNLRYLSHMTVDIVEKVPCIKFLIPNSTQIIDDLISEVAKKRELMYLLLGVFEMMINNTPVLMEDEDKNFTFELALQKAVQFGNNEAVQLLLDLSNVDRIHDASKPFPVASDPGHLSVDITSLLNKISINPNTLYDETGYPKLIRASGNGVYQMVEILLKKGADPDIHDNNGWTALIVASKNGHQQIVELLLKKQVDPNVQNSKNGRTALIQASQQGHYQVVEILLKKGADPNIHDNNGWTALINAAENGHQQVVELLLERQVNPNVRNSKNRRTALIQASQQGHYQVVEILLKKGADPNIHDNNGRTALIVASKNGHYQVVEILHKNGADPNIHDNEGWTALIIAAQNGHQQVVELLLERQVDPNVQNSKNGRTALIQASQQGHYQVVEILLKKGADPNIHDNNGRTALIVASKNGHYQVVEVLLKKGADPNINDNNGRTALIVASKNGHYQVVEILLKNGADSNIHNNNGFPALIFASENGHYQVVEILLKNGADPDIRAGIDEVTALLFASQKGYYQIVDILLKNGADPNINDNNGWTALINAAQNGHQQVVELLLERQVDPNVRNSKNGITALIQASQGGHYQVVEILLQKGADPNIHDKEGWTALIIAAENGHQQVVELLLEKQVDPNDSKNGTTALIFGSFNGHYQVVELLLKKGADPNIHDNEGCTALIIASFNGHYQVVELLLKKGADPNIHDNEGWTALIFASFNGHYQVVELLLKKGADPNIHDNDGWTALILSSENGHQQIVELLLEKQVDPKVQNSKNGRTALIQASQEGHYQVVEILLQKGADPNIHDKEGCTALIIAAQNGHQQVVELLLERQVDPNVQNSENGITALIQASQGGHYQVVEILLQKGADPNIHDKEGWTALIIAAENGHQQVVELLLERQVDPNDQNSENGITALIQASQGGHYQVVEILLQKGADPNIHDKEGWTALIIAAENGHQQVVELLLEKQVDPNVQNSENGRTALIQASSNGHYQVVELLLKKGADFNIHDNSGLTALIMASHNGHYQVVELLLKKGADPNIHDNEGCTALIFASFNGHYQVVELLLKKGADPNIHNNRRGTALMVASQKSHSHIIEVLLKYNANPHYFATVDGVSVDSFAYAAVNGNIECLNIFLKHTELSLKSLSMGWYFACGFGQVPIIRLLSNRLDIISDQRDLIISCAEGDLRSVVDQLMSGKITPDFQFVHGVTPLIISSCCGHTDIVEALITAGANVNKIDEFGHTALDFTEKAEQDATRYILLQHGGVKDQGPESESDEDKITSEETKLCTDASQSNIKSSQDSLSIRKKELNTKKRPFLIMKKLFKDTVKYSQSFLSQHQRFDNREYSTTTHIP